MVIAIIAILASMLLPALSKARAKAKSISCVSNLKGLGTVYLIYSDDWNGWIPPVYDDLQQQIGEKWSWKRAFEELKYIPWMGPSFGNLACPSAPNRPVLKSNQRATWQQNSYGAWRTGGSWNYWCLNGFPRACSDLRTQKWFEVVIWNESLNACHTTKKHSEVMLLADSYDARYNREVYYINRYISVSVVPDKSQAEKLAIRHSGMGNMVFADGHAASLARSGLAELGWVSACAEVSP